MASPTFSKPQKHVLFPAATAVCSRPHRFGWPCPQHKPAMPAASWVPRGRHRFKPRADSSLWLTKAVEALPTSPLAASALLHCNSPARSPWLSASLRRIEEEQQQRQHRQRRQGRKRQTQGNSNDDSRDNAENFAECNEKHQDEYCDDTRVSHALSTFFNQCTKIGITGPSATEKPKLLSLRSKTEALRVGQVETHTELTPLKQPQSIDTTPTWKPYNRPEPISRILNQTTALTTLVLSKPMVRVTSALVVIRGPVAHFESSSERDRSQTCEGKTRPSTSQPTDERENSGRESNGANSTKARLSPVRETESENTMEVQRNVAASTKEAHGDINPTHSAWDNFE